MTQSEGQQPAEAPEPSPEPRVSVTVAALIAVPSVLTYSFALDGLPAHGSTVVFAVGTLVGAAAGGVLAIPLSRRPRQPSQLSEGPATLRVMAAAAVFVASAGILRATVPLTPRVCALGLGSAFAIAFITLMAVLGRRTVRTPGQPRRPPAHRRARIPEARNALGPPHLPDLGVLHVDDRAPGLQPIEAGLMHAMADAMTQATRTLDPALVSQAMVVWTGKGGRKPFASGGDTRVVERFGAQAANELVPELRRLHDEFLGFPAPDGHTKWQAADAAAADFGARYASLSSAALEALRWCYAHEVANE